MIDTESFGNFCHPTDALSARGTLKHATKDNKSDKTTA